MNNLTVTDSESNNLSGDVDNELRVQFVDADVDAFFAHFSPLESDPAMLLKDYQPSLTKYESSIKN